VVEECAHKIQNWAFETYAIIKASVFVCVVLYGCETLSLTVREEHKLRVFENRVLRIFGPK
jgi:hypothetical protein